MFFLYCPSLSVLPNLREADAKLRSQRGLAAIVAEWFTVERAEHKLSLPIAASHTHPHPPPKGHTVGGRAYLRELMTAPNKLFNLDDRNGFVEGLSSWTGRRRQTFRFVSVNNSVLTPERGDGTLKYFQVLFPSTLRQKWILQ
jgi:hypothetical protein